MFMSGRDRFVYAPCQLKTRRPFAGGIHKMILVGGVYGE